MSNQPTPTVEILALVRTHAARGEPGIAFIAGLVDAFKRERDRAERLAEAYLGEITRLNRAPRNVPKASAPELGQEPSDAELGQGLRRSSRSAPTADRTVLSADDLDI